MTGHFRDKNSRLYELERRFGSFEAILKGNLWPHLTQEVKNALSALPRTFSEVTKLAFKDFFDRYGPFIIDQVYNGGTIKATVALSDGASVEAENSASATYSGIRSSLGKWTVGWGSGGGGGDSSLSATLREKAISEIQVLGGDHTNPLAFNVMDWTSEDYERWMQSVFCSKALGIDRWIEAGEGRAYGAGRRWWQGEVNCSSRFPSGSFCHRHLILASQEHLPTGPGPELGLDWKDPWGTALLDEGDPIRNP